MFSTLNVDLSHNYNRFYKIWDCAATSYPFPCEFFIPKRRQKLPLVSFDSCMHVSTPSSLQCPIFFNSREFPPGFSELKELFHALILKLLISHIGTKNLNQYKIRSITTFKNVTQIGKNRGNLKKKTWQLILKQY